MGLQDWLTIALICFAGAATPGISLAIVIKHSASHGRLAGILTSWAHALGVGIYAFLTVYGLDILLGEWPWIYVILILLGALYLGWLGWQYWQSFNRANEWSDISESIEQSEMSQADSSYGAALLRGMQEGFSIAIFNPKVLVFYTAVFAGFTHVAAGGEKFGMGLLALIIDGLWYSLIAILITIKHIRARINQYERHLDGIFAGLFALFAIYLLGQASIEAYQILN